MSTRFTTSSIIYNDGTGQTTAIPVNAANNTQNGANGALFVDKSGNDLRFKNITTDGAYGTWTVSNPGRSEGVVKIFYNPGSSPPAPVGSK